MIPFINKKTGRIHSYFHQTVTATGRISSTEPNLQNIPTRIEIGKMLRKVFKPAKGKIFLDADYSQIELRVLAHISKDENMVESFINDEDIHAQAASRVFGVPLDMVTKELRSKAKAVNFGIVYGISDFGLAGQIHTSRKEAKQYIEQYLEKYSGIKRFMDQVVEEAKEKGIVANWCANEKTALEASIGVAYAGKRAMTCMKHVGLNVCGDPFMNAAIIDPMEGTYLSFFMTRAFPSRIRFHSSRRSPGERPLCSTALSLP